MFTILDEHDEPLLEIRRKPFSVEGKDGGFFPPESCHIRLTNNSCYRNNCIDVLRDFMARFDYELRKIYRLDICLDFERFDHGDDPAKFMARYMAGRYSKVNQSNLAAHGTDTWEKRVWNSASWGRPKSMVSTKFYNKSLELQQVHEKPYIAQAWFHAHLVDDWINLTKRDKDGNIYKPAIWRVEFSIKSSANKWFIVDKAVGGKGRIAMPHSLDVYDTNQKLLTMFASLAMHYFHFKVYEEGVRKDRCRDKVLFDFSPNDTYYKIDRLASHTAKTKPIQRLIVLLRNFYAIHPNPEVYKATEFLISILERDQIKQYLDSAAGHKEILLLQRLIAERMGTTVVQPLAQHMKQLSDLFSDLNDGKVY